MQWAEAQTRSTVLRERDRERQSRERSGERYKGIRWELNGQKETCPTSVKQKIK